MAERQRLPRGQARIQAHMAGFRGSYHLNVPAALARRIGPDVVFSPELVPEGLLYRYVSGTSADPPQPAWLRGEA